MIDVSELLRRADAYKVAAGVSEDSTVSHRVFGDTKKLAALRHGADITVRRFNGAMQWFDSNWPSATADSATAPTQFEADTVTPPMPKGAGTASMPPQDQGLPE